MTNDLFLSMYSRADLADYYIDYYKDIYGRPPVLDDKIDRAGLVDLIERLDLALMNTPELFFEDLDL